MSADPSMLAHAHAHIERRRTVQGKHLVINTGSICALGTWHTACACALQLLPPPCSSCCKTEACATCTTLSCASDTTLLVQCCRPWSTVHLCIACEQ
eukprot:1138986-Pelagomonas_calceolata.AAC.8